MPSETKRQRLGNTLEKGYTFSLEVENLLPPLPVDTSDNETNHDSDSDSSSSSSDSGTSGSSMDLDEDEDVGLEQALDELESSIDFDVLDEEEIDSLPKLSDTFMQAIENLYAEHFINDKIKINKTDENLRLLLVERISYRS